MKKMTVGEIAKLSGVSKATVSRVLNSTAQVSDDVRLKVESVIEQTGYKKKNQKVQFSLDFQKITIISDEEDVTTPNSFFSSILHGLKQEAAKLDLQLELVLKNQIQNPNVFESKLQASEAVIMIGMDNVSLLKQIQSHDLPVIIMNGVDPEMHVSSISPDYELGAFLATSVLAQHNHKNIKLVTADIKHSTYQRTEGFRRAMLMLDLPYDSKENIIDLVKHADSIDETGQLKALIKKRAAGMDFGASQILPTLAKQGMFSDCSAIFCMCDMIAISLIDALTEAGLKVPQDISVIGFDDLNISSMTSPPLTTIRTDYTKLAASAIHMLIQAARDQDQMATRSNVGVKLISRDSIKRL